MKAIKVVCGIIIENRRLLAARRGENMSHPLKWELPGGKIEAGETPGQAVIRELKEELGIDVSLLNPLQARESLVHDYGMKKIELIPVFAEIKEGSRPAAAEHHEIRWICADEAAGLDWAEADSRLLLKMRGEFCQFGFCMPDR